VTSDELGTHTRLVLPVPELASLVPGAHIPLLDPFLPVADVDAGVVAELRELFAELVPFPFVLGEAVRFPTGAAYLPPQPVAAFRRITQVVRRAFPEVAEPASSLAGAIPHLALPDDVAEGARTLPTPLEVHAAEALLLGPDGALLAAFRFGTSAA
jgi:hypothetical protein